MIILLKKFLLSKYSRLLALHFEEKKNQIKAMPNVFIGEGFVLGEGSEINIEGICKEVNISTNLWTRRFCHFLIYPNARLVIHNDVFFNNHCSVNCLGNIEIGRNTIFGENVKMYDHNHKHHYGENNQLVVDRADFKIGKITIGENCWIGSNVTILNNVQIGNNVIIGANNLIYKSIPDNAIVKSNVDHILINK